jgi:hypothetical protein
MSVFGWLRRTRVGKGNPPNRSLGEYPRRKRADSDYWERANKAITAALTGDQREEYLAALTELSDTMTELGVTEFRACTRTSGGPIILTPAQIRQRAVLLRHSVSSPRPL